MALQTTSLQSQTPGKFQYVIANQCAHLWQSVFPAEKPKSEQYFRRIRSHLPFRLKYCCFAMPYRRGYGLPRRFAPRNDMQKLTACSHCKEALPGKFAPACAFTRQPPLPPHTPTRLQMSLRGCLANTETALFCQDISVCPLSMGKKRKIVRPGESPGRERRYRMRKRSCW